MNGFILLSNISGIKYGRFDEHEEFIVFSQLREEIIY